MTTAKGRGGEMSTYTILVMEHRYVRFTVEAESKEDAYDRADGIFMDGDEIGLDDITAEDVRRYLRAEGWEMLSREGSGAEWWALCGHAVLLRGEDDLERIADVEDRPLSAVAADVRRLRDEAQCPRTIADGPHRRCEHCPPDVARVPALPVDPDVDDAVEALVWQHDRSGEARPIQAADVRTVTGCEDCPASSAEPRIGGDLEWWCGMSDQGTHAATPPDWCPLRRGPVTLRLEVE